MDESYRVVFEVASGNAEQWSRVLGQVENVRNALGRERTTVEVVAHGGGLPMLRRDGGDLAARVESAAGDGVVFSACSNTMKREHVAAADLARGVGVVDSGLGQVVRLQARGYAYVKAA